MSSNSNNNDIPKIENAELKGDASLTECKNVDSQLTAQITVNFGGEEETVVKQKTGLVLVVDRSGSMGSYFSRQVVPALIYVAEKAYELDIQVQIIDYDSRAKINEFNSSNYKQKLGALRTGGATSFQAAFESCRQSLARFDKSTDKIVIAFMTDGCDTCGSYVSGLNALKTELRALKKQNGTTSTCHSIAFTASHDFTFLDKLRRELGTEEGGFQYAEPSDGPNALQEKLECVFDVVASTMIDAKLLITAPDNYKFVVYGDEKDELKEELEVSTRIEANVPFNVSALLRVNEGQQGLTSDDNDDDDNDDNKKMAVDDDNNKVALSMRVCLPGDKAAQGTLNVATRRVPADKSGAIRAKMLTDRLEALEQSISAAASAAEPERIKALSRQLAKHVAGMASLQESADLFSLCKGKQARRDMLEQIKAFSGKANELSATLATLSKGQLSNAQKARFAELAHGQQFKRARRQRDLDQRAARNVETLQKAEAALAGVVIDTQALAKVSEDVASEFRCVLSQETWVELIAEPSAAERDVIGFGIAVQRPENVVDDPTQLRVRDVSVTTVGLGAFEDATAYKLSTDARFARSEAFSLDGDVAVAMRGAGREPINGWAPLYIHAEHWKMVLPQLPSALGYLVTVDKLGWNSNQLDVLFLLLGTMAMSLREPGQRDLRLLMQFHRTCVAAMQDMNWAKRAEQTLAAFVASPLARLKDQTTNLVVLVGYMLALPSDTVEQLLPNPVARRRFWLALLGEAYRRAADSMYEAVSGDADALVTQLTDGRMVGGNDDNNGGGASPLDDAQLVTHPALDKERGRMLPRDQRGNDAARGGDNNNDDDDDNNNRKASGKAGVSQSVAAAAPKAPAKTVTKTKTDASKQKSKVNNVRARALRHCISDTLVVDPAAELAVANAVRVSLLGLEPTSNDNADTVEKDPWAPARVDQSMLDAVLQFEQAFRRRGHPSVAAILSLATYVDAFQALAKSKGGSAALWQLLDGAGGVAPSEWCDELKLAFEQVRAPLGNGTAALVALLDAQHTAADASVEPTNAADTQALARAAIVRAVRFRQNKRCREAIEAGNDGDATTVDGARALLSSEHLRLKSEAKSDAERESKSRKIDVAIASCLRTSDLVVFVGWLRSDEAFGARRNTEQFRALWHHFLDASEADRIALAADKLRILLSGVYTDANGAHNILDDGRAWLPSRKAVNRVKRAHPSAAQIVDALQAELQPELEAQLAKAKQEREQRKLEARGVPKQDDFPSLSSATQSDNKKAKKNKK